MIGKTVGNTNDFWQGQLHHRLLQLQQWRHDTILAPPVQRQGASGLECWGRDIGITAILGGKRFVLRSLK